MVEVRERFMVTVHKQAKVNWKSADMNSLKVRHATRLSTTPLFSALLHIEHNISCIGTERKFFWYRIVQHGSLVISGCCKSFQCNSEKYLKYQKCWRKCSNWSYNMSMFQTHAVSPQHGRIYTFHIELWPAFSFSFGKAAVVWEMQISGDGINHSICLTEHLIIPFLLS